MLLDIHAAAGCVAAARPLYGCGLFEVDCPAAVLSQRAAPTRNSMLGCMVRARSNTWLTAFSLSPAHFDRIMLGLMDSRLNSASAATFSTSIVCRAGNNQYLKMRHACFWQCLAGWCCTGAGACRTLDSELSLSCCGASLQEALVNRATNVYRWCGCCSASS
jgi:hypothetical protein